MVKYEFYCSNLDLLRCSKLPIYCRIYSELLVFFCQRFENIYPEVRNKIEVHFNIT